MKAGLCKTTVWVQKQNTHEEWEANNSKASLLCRMILH
jgi:hypothetical protein